MSDHTPVTFENSSGETISNDPVWHAQQTLAAYGQPFTGSQPAALARTLEAQAAPEDDEDMEDDDAKPPVDADGNRTYAELNGTQLKTEAKDRGIDITGLKKVGEVRQALRDADAAAKAEGSDSDSDDDED